ncbi:GIY-YIG nuclease family protein [Curtobacterium sp. PhB78]|uniref:GIY-YIG nuclease family protein n=1 Tax=Curtobacterium sp. PhB78 TaxID=2485102 RepID=UPI0037C068D1
MNRYDQSDLNIYGAEDDFEMDAIMDAKERADLSAPYNAAEPVGDDWTRLLAATRTAARSLARPDLPDGPGVYLWSRRGAPQYVGTASSVQKRIFKHLGGGVSLASSSLRRNVCELLFQIPPHVTGNPTRQKVTAEQATAIRSWLLGCDVSWLRTRTEQDAAAMEGRLRRAFRPPFNRV